MPPQKTFVTLWKNQSNRLTLIPSEVENRAAGDAARWTARPKAERVGNERIKSQYCFRAPRDLNNKGCLDFARHDKDTERFG
jgi:hypothetical protein